VRDVLGLVGRQQHRRAVAQGGQRPPQVGALRRVEPGRRLVQHDQPRLPEQRLRQPDPPALPTGQTADPDGGLVGEPDRVEHPAYLLGPGLAIVPLLEDGDVLRKPKAVMSEG
jgi:hypothetical protein